MSKEAFARAWAETGRAEGGYVNDPSDSGGPTNWGITEKVARKYEYYGPMRDLPKEKAEQIAKRAYWDVMNLDKVEAITGIAVPLELFDTGFNTGTQRAVEFLQRSLNVLNRLTRDYRDIEVDGDLGPATLQALHGYIAVRHNTGVLLKALNCLQGAFYIELAEKRQKDETFVYGWLSHRVSL